MAVQCDTVKTENNSLPIGDPTAKHLLQEEQYKPPSSQLTVDGHDF